MGKLKTTIATTTKSNAFIHKPITESISQLTCFGSSGRKKSFCFLWYGLQNIWQNFAHVKLQMVKMKQWHGRGWISSQQQPEMPNSTTTSMKIKVKKYICCLCDGGFCMFGKNFLYIVLWMVWKKWSLQKGKNTLKKTWTRNTIFLKFTTVNQSIHFSEIYHKELSCWLQDASLWAFGRNWIYIMLWVKKKKDMEGDKQGSKQ